MNNTNRGKEIHIRETDKSVLMQPQGTGTDNFPGLEAPPYFHTSRLLLSFATHLIRRANTNSMVTTPSESASRVPNITALRTALQYGDLRLPRCDAFHSSLTLFRKSYITSTGMRGVEVHDWKSPQHQDALTEMSHAFLDRDGNGELYWPTDATLPNFTSLQYANHQSLIRKCVKELLYRLNVQQYRNAKYRRKGLSIEDNTDDANDHPVDSIEIFSGDEGPRSATEDTHVQAATTEAATVTRSEYNGQGHNIHRAEPASTVSLQTSPIADVENDEFAVPDDFDWLPSHRTSGAPKRRLRKSGGSQRLKRVKPSLSRRAPKRVGMQDTGGSLDVLSTSILQESAKSAPDKQRTSGDQPDGSAAKFAESPAATSMHRTPEDLINYIRSNRPLTTSEPATVLVAAQCTHSSQVEPSIDPALNKYDAMSSARPSSGGTDTVPNGPHSMERPCHTASPIAPSRTVPDSEGTPEARPTNFTEITPTLEFSSTCMDAVNTVVQIKYRLVLMHRSIPIRQAWTPKGSLLNKTLQGLKSEIPIKESYKGFILRLRAPSFCTEQFIDAGNEFEYECAKEDLNNAIRRLAFKQKRTQPGKALPMFIEVEPQGSDDEDGDMKEFESVKIEW